VSLVAYLDPAGVERERLRKAEARAASIAKIAAATGITPQELEKMLTEEIQRQQLEHTQKEVDAMRSKGVTR